MVGVLLAVVALVQVPQVEVRTDRSRVGVNEIVTVTVTVRAAGALPVTIEEPDFPGFAVLDRRDRSEVSVEDGTRTTQRDLLLRAERPGTAVFGPFVVRQGESVAQSATVVIAVTGAAPTTASLSPRVRTMVRRASPEGGGAADEIEVSVLSSAEEVVFGEQIDLVVAAWFPRDVRNRLRAPPTLLPPDVRGAWGYAQPTPAGVVATREVGGRTYDLFVHHEIVFPLTSGDLEVGPATVSYSLPISGSFLSREIRHEQQSGAFLIAVVSPPESTIGHVVPAREMELAVEVPETELRVGDAVVLSVRLSGVGNVALWPEPELRWPEGLQAYQQRAAVQVTTEAGLLGGTKLFEYLVVADSSGLHRLPPPRYRYFDLARGRQVTIAATSVDFVTPERSHPAEPVRAAPSLLAVSSLPSIERMLRTAPEWFWLLVFGGPPALALGFLLMRRSWSARRRSTRLERTDGDALSTLEAEVREALRRLVPGADVQGGDRLATALVAAGVEASLAAHAARVRERLLSALYGPDGGTDATELAQEVHAVLSALRGAGPREVRALTSAALLVLVLLPWPLQGQSVEQLWQAGAVRAAADSLLARTRREPNVAAHWHNLGLALEQMGEDARASAAWLQAARLAPRNRAIRRGRRALRTLGHASREVLWVAPLTPMEALALAAGCWVVGWAALIAHRRRAAIGFLVLALVCTLFAGFVKSRYDSPIGFVIETDTPLREAPYGPAPETVPMERGAAVRIERVHGDWRLVALGHRHGWMHATELVDF
jgi:hypothetical protein